MNREKIQYRPCWLFPAVVGLLLLHSLTIAAQGLYSAEAEVADDSAEARKASIEEAFHQVLIQVTGDREVAGRGGIPQLISQASSYVQQYRFRIEQPEEDQPEATAKRYIVVQFDKRGVDRALGGTSVRAWSGSRPQVLLWLAREQQGRRAMVSPENEPEIMRTVNAAAGQRGLPLQLPLMDLQDQASLTASDLWAGYAEIIADASRRYPHNVVLTGKITGGGNQWRVKWNLYDKGKVAAFETTGSVLTAALADGLDNTSDKLLRDYAPTAGVDEGEPVLLRIVEVQAPADFSLVMSVLTQQDVVSRLTVANARSDELVLKLWLTGSLDSLERGLALTGQLIPATHVSGVEQGYMGQEPRLTYRIQ